MYEPLKIDFLML